MVLNSAVISLHVLPNFSPIGACIRALLQILRSAKKVEEKNQEKKRHFDRSYLVNGFGDCLQILYVDSPTVWALLQQTWLQSDKGSKSYKGMKITFTFFLLIYSWCGAPASWAARHTTVCLDFNSGGLCRVHHCAVYP